MASTEELDEQIEAAEEAGDTAKLLEIVTQCTPYGTREDDDWADTTEASLDAVYRLAKSGKATSGMSVIFAALDAWKGNEAIVEVALGCIVSLSKSYSTEEEKEVDVALLWSMMKPFPGESTIQEQACLAIEGLALASEKCKAALLKVDNVESLLAAAKENITNERNKAYPGRAAEALGVSVPP
ncbi:expressed unknown protein [Seminavis robusta]|uniref:Uncharacterized protein n=1 Tax=Seminavis robusta TaxID=568900 RepID=A0A9N8HXA4_9STRA|nr:expressed unknown protein [Seminavis robusta]|eukprot:Sro3000_g341920.1 n/a (184) ;mRNA; f:427-978